MNESKKYNKLCYWAAITIMIIAGALRIALYVNTGSFFIDEANVARNIYERDFAGLLQPLNYEQYAPPLFLLTVKLCAVCFGYSEYALTLFPLLSSLAVVFIFYRLLRRFFPLHTLWYPLALLSVGYATLFYSIVLKQYMSDVLVCIILVSAALSIDIIKIKAVRFVVVWLLVSSVAIWLSMPSVFVLTGISCYYFSRLVLKKEYKRIIVLIFTALLWLVQFGFYYLFILKPQANSEYLQNFHNDYFMSIADWQHNIILIKWLISSTGGFTAITFWFNTAMIVIALAVLYYKNLPVALLLSVPILCMFAASVLNQYSLIERLVLFSIPLLLILIGHGHYLLISATKSIYIKGVVYLLPIVNVVSFAVISANHSYEHGEVRKGMRFAIEQGVTAGNLFVNDGAGPEFIYYTTIHPNRNEWCTIKDAGILKWYTNYDSLAREIKTHNDNNEKTAFIINNFTKQQLDKNKEGIEQHLQLTDQLDRPYVKTYIYTKPEKEQ